MRHHNANRKFGRVRGQRKALLRSLAQSLIVREKIKTTEPKAKELRPFIEKMITRSKTPTLAVRRFLITEVGGEASKKLLDIVGPKYKGRSGGYTRILKLGVRKSDAAAMAQIELV